MAYRFKRSRMQRGSNNSMGKGLAGAALAVGTAILAWRRWGRTGDHRQKGPTIRTSESIY